MSNVPPPPARAVHRPSGADLVQISVGWTWTLVFLVSQRTYSELYGRLPFAPPASTRFLVELPAYFLFGLAGLATAFILSKTTLLGPARERHARCLTLYLLFFSIVGSMVVFSLPTMGPLRVLSPAAVPRPSPP
jgi:hypothetical protein